ncbi:DUF4912 domain-containing protein [uncultured Fibrobacter sp.]|uniref:DUF4912 domain-containing protein n=1 Tax=uncultured Fibrobacter sp. TaxID=261512 RepID=UPI0025DA6C56|nr:DUF4912 domain-containing protein [uncultured Fibrobacter sp.]
MATKKTVTETKAKATTVAKKTAAKAKSAVEKTTAKVKTAVKAVEKTVSKIVAKAPAKNAAATTKKAVATKKAAPAKAPVAKKAAPVAKKAAPVAKSAPKASEQTDVKASTKKVVRKAAAKVPAAKASAKAVTKSDSLAQSFDPEYLVLMQKDPNWMQAFWEVSENRIKNAKKGKGKLVLRLFDISDDLTVKRGKKRKFHDVVVPADARSWYVENKASNNTIAVLGFAEGKNFMPLVESVPVQTSTLEGSQVNVDDVFVKASLGGAAMGGFGSSGLSSMSAKNWLESLSSSSGSMFSGALSSAALKSNKLELPKDSVNYGKDFFLWVKTRLIVYGGTRPDAHLQVRGEPFPLNADGTFSFEEDLPDCTKIIPVFATDKDGDFPTTIVPIVVKRTE